VKSSILIALLIAGHASAVECKHNSTDADRNRVSAEIIVFAKERALTEQQFYDFVGFSMGTRCLVRADDDVLWLYDRRGYRRCGLPFLLSNPYL
jgi:hypothetical protein